MTTIADLRSALLDIPTPLLGPDERRVRDEALASLEALSQFDIVPVAVTFVGSSGSGKSTIFNVCVGFDASPASVVRPTTTNIVMAGGSGPVSVAVESEYVHAINARPGVVFIDTPSWEHSAEAVEAAMDVADLVVVVVTPSRYADAEVARLVASLPDGRPAAVVLNRIDADPDDRAMLRESVADRYGSAVVDLDEGGDVDAAVDQLLEGLEIDTVGYQRGAVLRSSASAGGRFLAGAVTSLSTEVGGLANAIEQHHARPIAAGSLPVRETWDDTRTAIVSEVTKRVAGMDEDLSSLGSGDIAGRIGEELEPWQAESLERDLDRWREVLVDTCTAHATMRWRRKAGRELIERNVWKAGVHPGLDLPPRIGRMLGSNLDRFLSQANTELLDLIDAAIDARRTQWASAVAALGGYTPGELLAAADGFAPRGGPGG